MILRSRRWRLTIRFMALVITSLLMLAFAGPVSYALQDDSPRHIVSPRQLLDKDAPVEGAYVSATGVPDLAHAFGLKDGGDTYYWIPLAAYDSRLLVRAASGEYLFPYDYDSATGFSAASEVRYVGKVTSLKGQPNADKIVEELAGQGIVADQESTMVLLLGEKPSTYRPIVPVMPALALLWAAALAGLLQIWLRKSPRRRLKRAAQTTH